MATQTPRLEEAAPLLEVFYMKMIQPHVDARQGKLPAGRIVSLDRDKATRWFQAHVAEQTTQAEYEAQQARLVERSTAAKNAFDALSDAYKAWDVSTYRDVLTAPEGGLRIAYERDIPLVNVHMLRDEYGDPLPPDADIDAILDARANLHPDLQAPLSAHDRSSVMGGGSMYSSPMPMNPQFREQAQRLLEADSRANLPSHLREIAEAEERRAGSNGPKAPTSPERANRAAARGRRSYGRVASEAMNRAREAGVRDPEAASASQTANADAGIPGGGKA